jgi:hypothetical protein
MNTIRNFRWDQCRGSRQHEDRGRKARAGPLVYLPRTAGAPEAVGSCRWFEFRPSLTILLTMVMPASTPVPISEAKTHLSERSRRPGDDT